MKNIGWLFLLAISQGLLAQQPLYTNAERFFVENGLPQNLVTGIVQDDDGFIWVSTMDGLARFDGKHFLVLRHKPNDSTSLLSNNLNSLFKDRHNKLWVQSNNQTINQVDPRTLEISAPKIPAITAPAYMEYFGIKGFWGNENNWVRLDYDRATSHVTLQVLDTTNHKLRKLFSELPTAGVDKLYAFSEDAEGQLWLATGKGFEIKDGNGDHIRNIEFPSTLQFDPESVDYLFKIIHLNDKRVALVGGNRIIIYDPQSDRFKLKEVSNDNPKKIQFTTAIQDVEGRLIFEYRNCIYRLEADDRISLLWKYPGNEGIRSIFIDRTNTLWIGTDPNGLFKVNLLMPAFISRSYNESFVKDIIRNELGVVNHHLDLAAMDAGSDYSFRYAYTRDGKLVIYISQGKDCPCVLQLAGQSLLPIFLPKKLGQLARGKNGDIIYLSEDGILTRWSGSPGKQFSTPLEKPRENPSAVISGSLAEDESSLWVTYPDVGTMQFNEGKYVQTIRPNGTYPTNIILNDPVDSRVLWIGAISGGLFKWEKKQNKLLANYTTENGLPNNTIYSIIPDSSGYLWMSTNMGITRFNPVKETFSNYNTSDGLVQSEFNRHHALLLPDGRIAMGGTKGYTVFNPNEFTEDTYAPEVFITGVSVNGKPVETHNDSTIMSGPLNQLSKINLSYQNNSISFTVAATQFNDLDKIKFRYKLKGIDQHWEETDADQQIRFNQLNYGVHTLQVNASNTLGTWSPAIREVVIVVHPPFWLTWWAYAMYAGIVGLLVQAYWRSYKNRLKTKQEVEFNMREAARLREVDEIKTRFFSNITHEFRTPLTLILTPLEKYLKDNTMSSRAHTLLNNNYRHATQLLELVNQLLDIAKIEAGQMPVNLTAGDLHSFLTDYIDSFQDMAQKKRIDLQFSIEGVAGNYLFDHEKWGKIIQNLLSNAVKFTPQGGTIKVSATTKNSDDGNPRYIIIQVRDTGVGIRKELLSKIFERFYQADDSTTRKHEGTGIGLSLVKELVELLNGRIDVESELNEGTYFTVELPVEKLKETPHAIAVDQVNEFQAGKEAPVQGIDHELPLILVVEDNDELRSFIVESLSSTWRVIEASNGELGWASIENELPEIVISDVMMPVMNGFELCKKTKQDHRTSHIGFIVLTAKAAHEAKIEGLESGADEYLTKPFHLYELELRINNLLREQNSLRLHLQEKLFKLTPSGDSPTVNDLFLSRLQVYLNENLSNSNLKIEMVADAMSMSKSTLNRKIKAILNTSINDYIKQYRLQQGAILLSAGHSVSEVSFQVGFETASYFARCFKDQYHKTPTEYVSESI